MPPAACVDDLGPAPVNLRRRLFALAQALGVLRKRGDLGKLRGPDDVFTQGGKEIAQYHHHRPHVCVRVVHADDHGGLSDRLNGTQAVGRRCEGSAIMVKDAADRIVYGLACMNIMLHPASGVTG